MIGTVHYHVLEMLKPDIWLAQHNEYYDLGKKGHFLFDSSLTSTHVPTTSYLTRPAETTGSVRDSSCRSAMRQRCCVVNCSDVTVLAAGPVVAIVKITSAHMLCPFVVMDMDMMGHG